MAIRRLTARAVNTTTTTAFLVELRRKGMVCLPRWFLLPDTQNLRRLGDRLPQTMRMQDGSVPSADQLSDSESATKAFSNPVRIALPGYKLLNSDLNYVQGLIYVRV